MGHFAKSSINSSPASLMSSYKPLSFEPNIPENDETIIYSGKSKHIALKIEMIFWRNCTKNAFCNNVTSMHKITKKVTVKVKVSIRKWPHLID